MVKIAIVGSEEKYWAEDQKKKAKALIKEILGTAARGHQLMIPPIRFTTRNIISCASAELIDQDVVLVSGRCPKGGVDIWAEEIAEELGIETDIKTPAVNAWNDKVTYKYEKYWVDWHGHNIQKQRRIPGSKKVEKGYRSRNIDIAEAAYILYDIEPGGFDPLSPSKRYPWSEQYNDFYRRSGGTWTKEHAAKIGKRAYVVVIS